MYFRYGTFKFIINTVKSCIYPIPIANCVKKSQYSTHQTITRELIRSRCSYWSLSWKGVQGTYNSNMYQIQPITKIQLGPISQVYAAPP